MPTSKSSRWIARATQHVRRSRRPTLTLCYLPHLDYGLQKFGPSPDDPRIATALQEVDELCGELIQEAERDGVRVVVVSEYGIVPVRDAVHINRVLRQAGLVRMRTERGRELLDAGASRAFAVVDHQLAHVYVQHGADVAAVKLLLEGVDGIDRVLDEDGKGTLGLDHPRSGELVALAKPDRWFSYYWWLDDAKAPDYAPTVDIHRKPGYDPMELFIDPAIRSPKAAIGWRLLKRKAGHAHAAGCHPVPRHDAGQRLAWPDHPERRGRAARDLERSGAAARRPGGGDGVQGSRPGPSVPRLTARLPLAAHPGAGPSSAQRGGPAHGCGLRAGRLAMAVRWILAAILIVFAALQYNDPDALLWIAIYGLSRRYGASSGPGGRGS